MREFVAKAKDGKTVRYRDPKRPYYHSSLIFALVPAIAAGLYFTPLGAWATLIPLLALYVIIPVADAIIGEDRHNPPEEVMSAMAEDPFYASVARAAVPLIWVSVAASLALIGTQDMPWWAALAMLLGSGLIAGSAITIGHELGHKNNRTDKALAMWSNAAIGYAHFRVEHNHGHHVHVATPHDPASARMGESIYLYALREIPGALKSGWAIEAARLRKKGKPVLSHHNEIMRGWSITLAGAAIAIALLGWIMAPVIILHHLLGWYSLTQANYIEHYGLLRQQRPDGRYEPCRAHHSWNTNHIFSNLLTLQLQRHSDHHANPMRPYQILRDLPDVPSLPSGYPGMFLLAAIPPLFFRVMDPKLVAWADGDLGKVHMLEAKRVRLERRWQQPCDA